MRVDPDVRDHVVASYFASMAPYLEEELLRLCVEAFAVAFGEDSANVVAAEADLAGTAPCAEPRDLPKAGAPLRERGPIT